MKSTMPPKKKKKPPPPKQTLALVCEYENCDLVFDNMEVFTNHITQHLSTYTLGSRPFTVQTFPCPWSLCGCRIQGLVTDFIRHIYFHSFHVKIKCVGQQVIDNGQLEPCNLDGTGRNLIPDLPERLQCGWEGCQYILDIPEVFYRHVDSHTVGFPEGNNVEGGCKCSWEGCDTICKSKHKLKEHLRSHTQEKIVACPVCGGLFSNRTKYLDHLKRQAEAHELLYQCSHCQKRFSSERLLRDHVRHHVNQYKCPCCDMTCATPSSLKQHLRYRHTTEKPYQCEHCSFAAKTSSDLRRHMDSHNEDAPYHCHIANCDYACRNYLSLTNHFKRIHNEENLQKYMCHVCTSVFSRGSKLTVHLKKKHKFRWPSGHCRFRYRMGDDGYWRLQTVRYESINLTEQRTMPLLDHTGGDSGDQSTVSIGVSEGDENQNAWSVEGVECKREYTEVINMQENSNSSFASASSHSSAFHIDESENGLDGYELRSSDAHNTKPAPGQGRISTSPSKRSNSSQITLSSEPLGPMSVFSNDNLSMPYLMHNSTMTKSPPKKRSTGSKNDSENEKHSIPVQLVDTGCIINIPNYDSSPSKGSTGPKVINMKFNNTSEDLTYNLEMLGDVALLVPSGAESTNKGKTSKRRSKGKSQSETEKTVSKESSENVATKESPAKRERSPRKRKHKSDETDQRKSFGNEQIGNKKLRLTSPHKGERRSEISEKSAGSNTDAGQLQVSVSISVDCSVRAGRRTRKGSPVRRRSATKLNETDPEKSPTPLPLTVATTKVRTPPQSVSQSSSQSSGQHNGSSKVLPKVKASLGTKPERASRRSSEGKSAKRSSSGSRIEQIVRDRSPVKSASATKSDIFSLFPGPRTRSKDKK